VKTELLVQINGVSSGEHDGSRVMLLAATNLPWELDEAMRRRLTKRVYIPLPEAEARRALFELNLGRIDVGSDVSLDELVEETEVRAIMLHCWLRAQCVNPAFCSTCGGVA
jgi:katanin p60 ATPase-containing subunit A1